MSLADPATPPTSLFSDPRAFALTAGNTVDDAEAFDRFVLLIREAFSLAKPHERKRLVTSIAQSVVEERTARNQIFHAEELAGRAEGREEMTRMQHKVMGRVPISRFTINTEGEWQSVSIRERRKRAREIVTDEAELAQAIDGLVSEFEKYLNTPQLTTWLSSEDALERSVANPAALVVFDRLRSFAYAEDAANATAESRTAVREDLQGYLEGLHRGIGFLAGRDEALRSPNPQHFDASYWTNELHHRHQRADAARQLQTDALLDVFKTTDAAHWFGANPDALRTFVVDRQGDYESLPTNLQRSLIYGVAVLDDLQTQPKPLRRSSRARARSFQPGRSAGPAGPAPEIGTL